eukprot:XP_011427107.1 PREDICTED: uncharacterized protein LOC105328057 [Crassostrea gigas]
MFMYTCFQMRTLILLALIIVSILHVSAQDADREDEAKAVLLGSTRAPDLGESAESSETERRFQPREHVPLNRELGEGWKERFAKWKKEHPDQRKFAERQENHVNNLLQKRMKQLEELKTGAIKPREE